MIILYVLVGSSRTSLCYSALSSILLKVISENIWCGYAILPLIQKCITDYAAANAVVDATHKYKKIFYEAGGDD